MAKRTPDALASALTAARELGQVKVAEILNGRCHADRAIVAFGDTCPECPPEDLV